MIKADVNIKETNKINLELEGDEVTVFTQLTFLVAHVLIALDNHTNKTVFEVLDMICDDMQNDLKEYMIQSKSETASEPTSKILN